mmetsp:Transcript_12501/g.34438  ORF Transcript_12501/g.34438 Transcript_12501/m.34438 type:complete len:401 (+) Transcript_12501:428-1630(+)
MWMPTKRATMETQTTRIQRSDNNNNELDVHLHPNSKMSLPIPNLTLSPIGDSRSRKASATSASPLARSPKAFRTRWHGFAMYSAMFHINSPARMITVWNTPCSTQRHASRSSCITSCCKAETSRTGRPTFKVRSTTSLKSSRVPSVMPSGQRWNAKNGWSRNGSWKQWRRMPSTMVASEIYWATAMRMMAVLQVIISNRATMKNSLQRGSTQFAFYSGEYCIQFGNEDGTCLGLDASIPPPHPCCNQTMYCITSDALRPPARATPPSAHAIPAQPTPAFGCTRRILRAGPVSNGRSARTDDPASTCICDPSESRQGWKAAVVSSSGSGPCGSSQTTPTAECRIRTRILDAMVETSPPCGHQVVAATMRSGTTRQCRDLACDSEPRFGPRRVSSVPSRCSM